ncbi:hypothetical protein LVD17_16795 [Fulvivirga ulvae]|uniref:hypothetical protein n=1 Tax=Fulvivirga ulvae TaxID=2904245 RepID=UPI001F3BBE1C|nr:hypothetical protein [Fulvivirga ulvae]UII29957.1 hypothetical protein LVD17_16795 [Fulvivirga ulvae]
MRLNYYLKYLAVASACLMNDTFCLAQQKVHVVTRHVTKKLDYHKGEELLMLAEKSKMDISTWDENYIELKIELTSRHTKIETAKAELDYLKYSIEKNGSRYLVKNYFQASDRFTKVKGNLSTSFAVKVPRGCPLTITNLYGELVVRDLAAPLNVKIRFVDMQMYGVNGKVELQSYFGNVRIKDTQGQLHARLEKTKAYLYGFAGQLDIESSYGEVEVNGSGHYTSFDIVGERTAVTIALESLQLYNYRLSAFATDIFIPVEMGVVLDENKNRSFTKNNGNNNTWINIKTTYSPINLKPNNDNVSKK